MQAEDTEAEIVEIKSKSQRTGQDLFGSGVINGKVKRRIVRKKGRQISTQRICNDSLQTDQIANLENTSKKVLDQATKPASTRSEEKSGLDLWFQRKRSDIKDLMARNRQEIQTVPNNNLDNLTQIKSVQLESLDQNKDIALSREPE